MKEFKRFTNVSIVSNCPKVIVPNKPKIVVFGKDSNDFNNKDYRSIKDHLWSVLPRIVNAKILSNWMGVRFDMGNSKLIIDYVLRDTMWDLKGEEAEELLPSTDKAFFDNCYQSNSLAVQVMATRYGFYFLQSGRAGYKFDLGEHGCYSWAFIPNL